MKTAIVILVNFTGENEFVVHAPSHPRFKNKRRAAESQRAEMEQSIEKTSTHQRANGQLVEVMCPPGYLLLQMAKLFAGVV